MAILSDSHWQANFRFGSLNEQRKQHRTYFKKDRRQYAHFVDGGIIDNLGLRAIYEISEISGGAKAFVERLSPTGC